jgi:hypothetical protein
MMNTATGSKDNGDGAIRITEVLAKCNRWKWDRGNSAPYKIAQRNKWTGYFYKLPNRATLSYMVPPGGTEEIPDTPASPDPDTLALPTRIWKLIPLEQNPTLQDPRLPNTTTLPENSSSLGSPSPRAAPSFFSWSPPPEADPYYSGPTYSPGPSNRVTPPPSHSSSHEATPRASRASSVRDGEVDDHSSITRSKATITLSDSESDSSVMEVPINATITDSDSTIVLSDSDDSSVMEVPLPPYHPYSNQEERDRDVSFLNEAIWRCFIVKPCYVKLGRRIDE